MSLNQLTEFILEQAINCLDEVKCSLSALSSFFIQENINSCLNNDDFHGVGQFLKTLSDKLSHLEDTLNCNRTYVMGLKSKSRFKIHKNKREI